MNIQDKCTNILEYVDRKIVARIQNEKAVATYYFESADHNSLEAVTFALRGGSVTATAVIPIDYFSMDHNIKFFYDAR